MWMVQVHFRTPQSPRRAKFPKALFLRPYLSCRPGSGPVCIDTPCFMSSAASCRVHASMTEKGVAWATPIPLPAMRFRCDQLCQERHIFPLQPAHLIALLSFSYLSLFLFLFRLSLINLPLSSSLAPSQPCNSFSSLGRKNSTTACQSCEDAVARAREHRAGILTPHWLRNSHLQQDVHR